MIDFKKELEKKQILVCCPTKNRYNKILKNTGRFLLHENFEYDFKFFVEPQDFEEYSKIIPEKNLVNINRNNQGLMYVIRFIKEYCLKNKYSYIFRVDDDINNVRLPKMIGCREKAKQGIKIEATLEDRVEALNLLIKDSLEMFKELGNEVKAVSIMYGSDFHQYNGKKWLQINSRLQSNYIIKTEYYFCDERIVLFDDFITFYNLIQQGLNTIRYGLTAIEVEPVGIMNGGLQSFDRRKLTNESKKYIETIFPELQWKKVDGKNWDYEPDFKKTKTNSYKL